MIKVRLHGEPAEIEKLIEIICDGFPAVRVLSISRNYKDRGASVYQRAYIDVAINEQATPPPAEPATAELIKIINKASL